MAAKTRQQKGFTLAEALMAMVILSIAAIGIVQPFSAGAAVQVEGWHRSLTAKLSGDLLEEIVNTEYDEIVNEWTDYSEAKGQVKDSIGNVFTDLSYADYSRDVTLQQTAALSNIKHQWITVRVYRNGIEMAELSSLVVP
jgi:prepilin-type N-terminal cleavage/methylation domain-containing protein